MKNLKKSLVFLTVFAVLTTSVVPAFAATTTVTVPSDVVGTEYEDAVAKLVALNVVSGRTDGNFDATAELTRAEAAKILCNVIGVGTAAESAKGTTKFTDVKADHWASGYINVAAEKGIIKGVSANQFAPEAKVTNAQVVTMLVRAAGLGPVVEGKGTWPSNYLAKASEVDILKDVTVTGSENAKRGVVAELAWNTLTTEKWGEMEYNGSEVKYGRLGKTLLSEKYSDYVYKDANNEYKDKVFEDVEVVATPFLGTPATEINKVKLYKDTTEFKNVLGSNTATAEVLVSGVDYYNLFGKKVDVMFGKDNKIVYLKVRPSTSKEGIVDEVNPANGTSNNQNGKIKVAGAEYSLAKQAKIFVNTVEYSAVADNNNAASDDTKGLDYVRATLMKDGKLAAKATLVLNDDGLVSTLNMFVADKANKQFVIKDITSETSVKDVANGTEQFKISEVEDKNKVNGYKTVIIKNGKVASGSDIKIGDVVTYINNGNVYYISVSDNKVTGTVTNIATDVNNTYKITISGKEYKMIKDGKAQMNRTGKVEDKENVSEDIKDFLNKEATISLNALGEIAYITGNVKTSASAQFGLVVKAPYDGTDAGTTVKYIKIKTNTSDDKTFVIKDETPKKYDAKGLVVSADFSEFIIGSLVQYKIEPDGKIKSVNLVLVPVDAKYDVTNSTIGSDLNMSAKIELSGSDTVKKDAKVIQVGTGDNVKYYYITDDTIMYNKYYKSSSDNKLEKVTWTQLVNGDGLSNTILDESTNGITIVFDKNNKTVKYLVGEWTNSDPQKYYNADDKYAIYVQTKYNVDGDKMIVLYVNGSNVEYEVSDNAYSGVEEGDLIKYDLTGENKFDGDVGGNAENNLRVDRSNCRDNADTKYKTSKIYSIDMANKLITFCDINGNQGTTYKVADDVVVYDVRNTSSIAKVSLDKVASDMYATPEYLKDGAYKVLVLWK